MMCQLEQQQQPQQQPQQGSVGEDGNANLRNTNKDNETESSRTAAQPLNPTRSALIHAYCALVEQELLKQTTGQNDNTSATDKEEDERAPQGQDVLPALFRVQNQCSNPPGRGDRHDLGSSSCSRLLPNNSITTCFPQTTSTAAMDQQKL